MFQTHKNFVEIDGILYMILKTVRESHNPVVDTWKEHLMADRVFKKEEHYFFVREVPEAEIVND